MYKYVLFIKTTNENTFVREIGRKESRMLDDEKKRFIDSLFRNEHIDFSDYLELYDGNDYVVLNTRQISSISIYEKLI